MTAATSKTLREKPNWQLPPDKPAIGSGIYELSDLHQILGVNTRKLKRWLQDYWEAEFANGHKYSWGDGKIHVNFYSMIEFFVFGSLRDAGVKVSTLKRAHKTLSINFKTQYPFATRNLKTDGKRVFVQLEKDSMAEASHNIQFVFKEIIDPFLKKVSFNKESGLAESFHPLGLDHFVSVDPRIMFGQPVIKNTRIPAEVLYQLFKGENRNAKKVARLYEISEDAVMDAVTFYEIAA